MNQDNSNILCPHCGEWNSAGREECIRCGMPLPSQGETTAGESAQPPVAPDSVPPTASRSETETIVILGFVLAGLGLFGCCCCFSSLAEVIAIVLGAIAYSRGDRRGLWIIIIGVVVLVISAGANIFWISSPEILPREMPRPWGRWV